MKLCSVCGKEVETGYFNYRNRFVCRSCKDLTEVYHLDEYEIIDGEIIKHEPLAEWNEANKRALFIDFCYSLFNNKLSGAAYRLMDNYVNEKGYTWLGMLRAMEWYYLVKKNDKRKAKNNIGIIPYIYEEANQYYDFFSNKTRKQYEAFLEAEKTATKTTITINTSEDRKKNEIDLNSL